MTERREWRVREIGAEDTSCIWGASDDAKYVAKRFKQFRETYPGLQLVLESRPVGAWRKEKA